MTVTDYNMKAGNGKHVRVATKVTFADGREIRFTEKLTKKEALRQARYQENKRLDTIGQCERAIALAIMRGDTEAEAKFTRLLNEVAAPAAAFLA